MVDGVTPDSTARITLNSVYASGRLTSTKAMAIAANSSGYFFFNVPRSDSTVINVKASLFGYDANAGVSLTIPNVDSVAFSTLVSTTAPGTTAVVIIDTSGSAHVANGPLHGLAVVFDTLTLDAGGLDTLIVDTNYVVTSALYLGGLEPTLSLKVWQSEGTTYFKGDAEANVLYTMRRKP